MVMINKPKLGMAVVLLLILSACGNSSREIAESTQMVARINDKEITTTYVERRLKRISPAVRDRALKSKEGQRKFIDSLVSRELLLQAAKEEKLSDNYAYKIQVQDYKNDLLVQTYLRQKAVKHNITVSEQEIEATFNAQQYNFKEQPEVRLSQIFLNSEVEAEDALKRVKEGEDYAKVAFERSVNRATAARGGDRGYIRKWQLPPSVAEMVFAMDTGQVSEVMPLDFGYTILKVTDKRMGKAVSLEVVAGAIKNKLLQDKQRAFISTLVENLKINAQVVVNESALASLNIFPGGDVKPSEQSLMDREKGKKDISDNHP
jgi:peptidyl-prolyl cis-trans isomerase C